MSDLKKYAVHMDVSASIVVEVYAKTPEEAEDKAWTESRVPSVCHQCSRNIDIHDFTGQVDVEEIEE